MRKNTKNLIICASAVMCLTAFGCKEVVVTNVNDYLTPPEGSVQLTAMSESKSGEVTKTTSNANVQTAANDTETTASNDEQTTSEDGETVDDKNEVSVNENTEIAEDDETETSEDDKKTDDDSDTSEEDADDDDAGEDNEDGENANEDENDSEEESDELLIPDTFDAVFYAEHNPDVVAAFGDSPEALYKHYIDYGMAEGRAASENADIIPESEDNAN